MARHIIAGPRGLGALLGFGWVSTVCGVQVPAGNGPDTGMAADCPSCLRQSDGCAARGRRGR